MANRQNEGMRTEDFLREVLRPRKKKVYQAGELPDVPMSTEEFLRKMVFGEEEGWAPARSEGALRTRESMFAPGLASLEPVADIESMLQKLPAKGGVLGSSRYPELTLLGERKTADAADGSPLPEKTGDGQQPLGRRQRLERLSEEFRGVWGPGSRPDFVRLDELHQEIERKHKAAAEAGILPWQKIPIQGDAGKGVGRGFFDTPETAGTRNASSAASGAAATPGNSGGLSGLAQALKTIVSLAVRATASSSGSPAVPGIAGAQAIPAPAEEAGIPRPSLSRSDTLNGLQQTMAATEAEGTGRLAEGGTLVADAGGALGMFFPRDKATGRTGLEEPAGDILHGSVHGGVKGLNALIELGRDAMEKLESLGIMDAGSHWDVADEEYDHDYYPLVRKSGPSPYGQARIPNLPDPETPAGKLASGISQFLVGFKGVDKALKGIKAASRGANIAKTAGTSFAADFAFFDGQEERLSNLVQANPELANPVNEFLAAKPGDGHAEGRLKNALEGLGVGMLAEGLVHGLRLTKVGREVTRGEMQAAEEATAAQKQQRATVKQETGKAPGQDYTDHRSPDAMHFSGQELRAVTPTEAGRLFVGSGNKKGFYAEREARTVAQMYQNDHGITAAAVETAPGQWKIRVKSVPPIEAEKELRQVISDLHTAALKGENPNHVLGVAGPEEAARVKAETGYDILLHKRSVNAEDIEHAMDRHNRQALALGE